MKQRIFCLIVVFSIMLGCASVLINAQAPDSIYEAELHGDMLLSGEVDMPQSNDELFAGYASKKLYPMQTMMLRSVNAGTRLSGGERKIYDILKAEIEKMADGTQEQTFVTIDATLLASYGIKISWTNTELGVEYIKDSHIKLVSNAFWYQIDISAIQSALMNDCPYELYWFDKTAGFAWNCTFTQTGESSDKITNVKIKNPTFYFRVAQAYQSTNYSHDAPTVDTAKTGATVTAVNNAKTIVNQYNAYSDYDKLIAYKNKICELVSYNTGAAENSSTPYGDPWQLIYVFDNNTSTNVVCEGYSKAFQYLCDLSTFQDNIACYTVTGTMSGGAHMWNTVTMDDGKNYLCDVTNSDSTSSGSNGSLFLAGASGSITSGYSIGSIIYRYDNDTIDLWGEDATSILAISPSKYIYTYSPITITQAKDIVYDGQSITAGLSDADITYSAELNGYTLTYVFTRQADTLNTPITPKDAGDYKITVTANKTGYPTYTKSKLFTIEKAMLTVTPQSLTCVYGEKPSANATAKITGFVNGETVDNTEITGNLTAIHIYNQYEDVGEYDFTVSGYQASNYDFNYQNGTLTVTPATLDVTWLNIENRFYGDGKEAVATVNGLFAGDDVSVTVSGDSQKFGTHTLTATLTGKDAKNYVISDQTKTVQYTVHANKQSAEDEKTETAEESKPAAQTVAEQNESTFGCFSSMNFMLPALLISILSIVLLKRKKNF